MFNSQELHIKNTRKFLKKQRLLARKHRKYMKLKELKRNNSFNKKTSFSLIKNILINTKIIIQFMLIYINYFLQKIWYIITTFFIIYILKPIMRLTSIKSIKKIHKKKSLVKKKKKKKSKNIFKKILFLGFILIIIVAGLFFVWFSTLEIPSIQNFENRKISNSTKIYDKTGEILLYDIYKNITRTVVDINDINQSAQDAIIAIEDNTFYKHKGVVWKSTLRAIIQTLMSRVGLSNQGTAGGSTITQQVVKNTILNRDKLISRKVKEWVLAYKIEGLLSKDEILEIYLNEAPYGGTIYGIEEASQRFFNIPASDLSIAQSAYLAAIPNLPTFYSPYGPNKDKLDTRQKTVLYEMNKYGYISNNELKQALNEEVEFLSKEDNFAKSLHFVQYIRAQLEEKYGVDMVENGGLRVITTLDYDLQQLAEEIIKTHIEEVEEEFDASNAALVAIESETGQILTMVGSRDYFDTEEFDGNFNVAISPRQPGSAFKPIAYATAFEKGYLPESTIFDTETQFNSRCEKDDTTSDDGCYSPNNYDFKFKGPFTFKNALAQSRNIPAIKVSYLAGVKDIITQARNMGISSLTEKADFYGLGLVLGGGEVSLLEMTSAYTVFANEGVYNKPTGILEITDINGNIIEKYISNEERVLGKNSARMINNILSDNTARTPLFGAQSFLYFGGRDVAGKTGTTNDKRDAWLIGYIPQVAVGVWTGNNDNSSMKKGSSISGKPWRTFMDEIIKNYDTESFKKYDLPDNFESYPNMIKGNWYGGTTVYIDTVSGKLATEFTPEETRLAVPQPDPRTILHWIDKNNPQVLNEERNDPQYINWDYGVQKYVDENLTALLGFDITLPTEYDDVHTAENSENFRFTIEGLGNNELIPINEEVLITIRSKDRSDNEIDKVQFFVNNAFVDTDQSKPFTFNFIPEELQYFEENNIIRVIVTDEDGIKAVQEINFKLVL